MTHGRNFNTFMKKIICHPSTLDVIHFHQIKNYNFKQKNVKAFHCRQASHEQIWIEVLKKTSTAQTDEF